MAKCRSCGAQIRWTTTIKGKSIPLDEPPVKRFVLMGRMGENANYVPTYSTHFETCPNADKHRKEDREDPQGSLFE